MKKFVPCVVCGKKAKWSYMPSDQNFCDKCVPRGCSCNKEDGEEKPDEFGRLQPCVEYTIILEEFHDDKEFIKNGWESYYKYNPDVIREDESEAEYWKNKYGEYDE